MNHDEQIKILQARNAKLARQLKQTVRERDQFAADYKDSVKQCERLRRKVDALERRLNLNETEPNDQGRLF